MRSLIKYWNKHDGSWVQHNAGFHFRSYDVDLIFMDLIWFDSILPNFPGEFSGNQANVASSPLIVKKNHVFNVLKLAFVIIDNLLSIQLLFEVNVYFHLLRGFLYLPRNKMRLNSWNEENIDAKLSPIECLIKIALGALRGGCAAVCFSFRKLRPIGSFVIADPIDDDGNKETATNQPARRGTPTVVSGQRMCRTRGLIRCGRPTNKDHRFNGTSSSVVIWPPLLQLHSFSRYTYLFKTVILFIRQFLFTGSTGINDLAYDEKFFYSVSSSASVSIGGSTQIPANLNLIDHYVFFFNCFNRKDVILRRT